MIPNWDEGAWDSGSWDSASVPPTPFPPIKKRKTQYKTMASNPTPDDDKVLVALAEDMADGFHDHEATIGILHNTEAVMRAAITAATDSIVALGSANVNLDAKYDTLQIADAGGEAVLKNCRLRMVKLYGGQYNSNWQAAGWPNSSTAIPRTQDERFTLLGTQKTYFTLNPTAESTQADATAALCGAAHGVVSNARAAVNTAETTLTTAKSNIKTAIQVLRKRVRGLIKELEDLIADDDPRWESFGLNIPANPSAPEGIASLTATAAGGGKIHVEWAYATRMAGTRMLTKRTTGAEIDDDFINAGTAAGLEKTLEDFVPGVIVQVKAIPYNDGGDGPESPVASVTVT